MAIGLSRSPQGDRSGGNEGRGGFDILKSISNGAWWPTAWGGEAKGLQAR